MLWVSMVLQIGVVQDSHEGRLKEAWLAEDGSLGIC